MTLTSETKNKETINIAINPQWVLEFHLFVTNRQYQWMPKEQKWADRSDTDGDRMSHEEVYKYFEKYMKEHNQ